MKQQGIHGASRAKKRFTTHADSTHLRAPDLVKREFVATRPNELWVADFTYCSTWSGVVYVAFIIDVCSRRLVGWKAARSMTSLSPTRHEKPKRTSTRQTQAGSIGPDHFE